MKYDEALILAKKGNTLMLPNFQGYFDWKLDRLVFRNGDFTCDADKLDVKNRDDWYYII